MEIFAILKTMFLSFISLLKQVPVFGTNLWSIMLGFFALSMILSVFRLLLYDNKKGGKD